MNKKSNEMSLSLQHNRIKGGKNLHSCDRDSISGPLNLRASDRPAKAVVRQFLNFVTKG